MKMILKSCKENLAKNTSLSKKETEIKQQYGCERFKNLPKMKNKSLLNIENMQ